MKKNGIKKYACGNLDEGHLQLISQEIERPKKKIREEKKEENEIN